MATAKKQSWATEGSGNSSVKPRSSKRALKGFQFTTETAPAPSVILKSLNDTFGTKKLDLFDRIKIGRQTGAKTAATETNGFFDSKVLSRTHAEIWCEKGKVYVKDVKSSNGTFVNSERLSIEGEESEPREIRTGDILEFGIDILNDDDTLLYKKVSCGISIVEMDFPSAPHGSDTEASVGRDPVTLPPPVPERPSMQEIRALNLDGLAMQLQTDLELSKEVGAELEQAKLAIGSLAKGSVSQQESKLNEVQKTLEETTTKLKTVSSECSQLQQQLSEYKSKATRERDQIIAERDSLREARDKAVEEVKVLQQKAEKEKAKYEEDVRKNREIISRQESEIKKISEDSRRAYEDAEEKRVHADKTIADLETRLASTAVSKAEGEKSKDEYTATEGTSIEKMEEKEEEWIRKLDKLQGQLKHLEGNNVELGIRNNALETKILTLEKELSAKSTQLSPGKENVRDSVKSSGKGTVSKAAGRKLAEAGNTTDKSTNRHSVGGGFLSQVSLSGLGRSLGFGTLLGGNNGVQEGVDGEGREGCGDSSTTSSPNSSPKRTLGRRTIRSSLIITRSIPSSLHPWLRMGRDHPMPENPNDEDLIEDLNVRKGYRKRPPLERIPWGA